MESEAIEGSDDSYLGREIDGEVGCGGGTEERNDPQNSPLPSDLSPFLFLSLSVHSYGITRNRIIM